MGMKLGKCVKDWFQAQLDKMKETLSAQNALCKLREVGYIIRHCPTSIEMISCRVRTRNTINPMGIEGASMLNSSIRLLGSTQCHARIRSSNNPIQFPLQLHELGYLVRHYADLLLLLA